MRIELEEVLNELAQYMLFGKEYTDNVYKREEIVQLDNSISDINKIYKNFKKIEDDNYWRMDEDEVFYRQAKYLENFEDDYIAPQIRRNSYDPFSSCYDYSGFSFSDFRTYFSWRTNVRKGNIKLIEWEYEQIYINELLNQIGCKDINDAMKKLIKFWKGYRKCTLEIDEYMPDIIKEFYIINDFKIPYTEFMKKFPIKVNSQSKDLREINKGIYSDKINFLNDISTYKILSSKLLDTQYGYLLNECIEKVFERIHQEFENKGLSLPKMLMRKNMTEYWWRPLKDYNIYKMEEIEEKSIIIEGTEKYELKQETWNKTTYSSHNTYKNTIGYILKSMECYIREYLGYRRLKLPNKTQILEDIEEYYCSESKRATIKKIYKINLEEIIKEETMEFLQNNKVPKFGLRKKKEDVNEFEQEEKVEVVFNEEQFAKIREKSEEIQKALIVEEIEDGQDKKIVEELNDRTIQDREIAEQLNERMIQDREIEIELKNEEVQNKEIAEIQTDKEFENTKFETKSAITQNSRYEQEININENSETTQNFEQEYKKETEENVFKKFTYNLNSSEKKILEVLLEKQDVENRIMQIAQSENEMLEVIISNINDKALETIGDTVIESDMSSIYEDYEEDIKQVL